VTAKKMQCGHGNPSANQTAATARDPSDTVSQINS